LLGGETGINTVATVYTAPFVDGWTTTNDYTAIIPATQLPHNLATYNDALQTPQVAFASTNMESSITISYNQVVSTLLVRAIQRKLTVPIMSGYGYITTRLNKGAS
jgi:hypothetical protein